MECLCNACWSNLFVLWQLGLDHMLMWTIGSHSSDVAWASCHVRSLATPLFVQHLLRLTTKNYQSSAWMTACEGIHQWPLLDSPYKGIMIMWINNNVERGSISLCRRVIMNILFFIMNILLYGYVSYCELVDQCLLNQGYVCSVENVQALPMIFVATLCMEFIQPFMYLKQLEFRCFKTIWSRP